MKCALLLITIGMGNYPVFPVSQQLFTNEGQRQNDHCLTLVWQSGNEPSIAFPQVEAQLYWQCTH